MVETGTKQQFLLKKEEENRVVCTELSLSSVYIDTNKGLERGEKEKNPSLDYFPDLCHKGKEKTNSDLSPTHRVTSESGQELL